MVLAASVDGPFCVLLLLTTIENDVLYILTVRENVIIRYVKVMRTLHLFFPVFYVNFSTFSVITASWHVLFNQFVTLYIPRK